MSNAYDLQGSLPGRFALEVDCAKFGHQEVSIHSGSSHHRAGLKTRDYPGNLTLLGRRIKGNDGLKDLKGLNNIKNNYFTIEITGNKNLKKLYGLDSLGQFIGSILIPRPNA